MGPNFRKNYKNWGGSMGLSIRVFIVEDDDTIKRLPLARYERLFKRDPNESLPKYAGKRVRYALIVVDLVNRRPIEIVRDEFGFLDFDVVGRLKVVEHEKQENLAFDMLAPFYLIKLMAGLLMRVISLQKNAILTNSAGRQRMKL
jgi:hypothetical protein